MYPTSNSSSASQDSRDPNGVNGSSGGGGLARYRSAPVSFLTTTVDSVINGQGQHTEFSTMGNHMVGGGGGGGGGRTGNPTRFFSPLDTTTSSNLTSSDSTRDRLQTTSFRLNEFATAFNGLKSTSETTTPSPLFRHGSSPAGFLNTLISSTPNDGKSSRLSSQLSFTGTNSLSQFSEEGDIVANSLIFSSSSHNKRAKIEVNGLKVLESELHFGFSESALEAATLEKLMDIPQDSVPCKIRAKRGFATHPRSIAERERRTRISGKLKKLQDLVPNMDKQTSYADMLDLAVEHIKGLQTRVQKLNKELQNCSCGCKPN